MNRALAAALLIAGCGGGEGGGGNGADGGSGSSLIKSPSVVLESGFGEATLQFTGTVSFPETIAGGKLGQLVLTQGRPFRLATGNELKGFALSSTTRTLTYAIRHLDPGMYAIFLGFDTTGDGKIGPGDLVGYYDGSAASPIVDPAAAKLIDLSASTGGIDFALGVAP